MMGLVVPVVAPVVRFPLIPLAADRLVVDPITPILATTARGRSKTTPTDRRVAAESRGLKRGSAGSDHRVRVASLE